MDESKDASTTTLHEHYAVMVRSLKKSGQAIADSLQENTDKADLLHMVVGVSGEAGELLDCVKKFAIYNKPIDRQNLIEELGDIEFYLQGVRDIFGIQRDETLRANVSKLAKRYPNFQYTDKRAQDRADKT